MGHLAALNSHYTPVLTSAPFRFGPGLLATL